MSTLPPTNQKLVADLKVVKAQEPRPFKVVEMSAKTPPPQKFIYRQRIPVGETTLLPAHGESGKTTLMLMLAIATALGIPLFGSAPTEGPVVFFSAEDEGEEIQRKVHHICAKLKVEPASLDGKLFVLDATEGDPVLFHEVIVEGVRRYVVTDTLHALHEYLREVKPVLVIVDNVSDVYDADENARAQVRAFCRAMKVDARRNQYGLVLLAHTNKATSSGVNRSNETYSGATAWHNSVRDRQFLRKDDKSGYISWEHAKHSRTTQDATIYLKWEDKVLVQAFPNADAAVDSVDRVAEVVAFVRSHTARGKAMPAAEGGSATAWALMKKMPLCKGLRAGDLYQLFHEAEEAGLLRKVGYTDDNRNDKARWEVVDDGAK